jgi:hypothetical protein
MDIGSEQWGIRKKEGSRLKTDSPCKTKKLPPYNIVKAELY